MNTCQEHVDLLCEEMDILVAKLKKYRGENHDLPQTMDCR